MSSRRGFLAAAGGLAGALGANLGLGGTAPAVSAEAGAIAGTSDALSDITWHKTR